jgi:hypothetical protein
MEPEAGPVAIGQGGSDEEPSRFLDPWLRFVYGYAELFLRQVLAEALEKRHAIALVTAPQPEQLQQNVDRRCACGNEAAIGCDHGKCGRCCDGCSRHGEASDR